MQNLIVSTALALSLLFPTQSSLSEVAGVSAVLFEPQKEVLASESLDLDNRYPVKSVSEGFKENILVNLGHLKEINNGRIILAPGEVFAFHKNLLPEFLGSKVITQRSEYRASEGYKLVSGLYGNGVCHLATLMNWVASEAGLEVTARVNHDFAPVPGVDRKYGTSIKFYPNVGGASERQNLYIKNNKDYPIEFVFEREGDNLIFSIKRSIEKGN
jgi:vancomycin resistance protein YoaR